VIALDAFGANPSGFREALEINLAFFAIVQQAPSGVPLPGSLLVLGLGAALAGALGLKRRQAPGRQT